MKHQIADRSILRLPPASFHRQQSLVVGQSVVLVITEMPVFREDIGFSERVE